MSAEKLAALREEMLRRGLDVFLVPRADKHQGEYVPACDERLSWLTGFTGSAGIAAVMAEQAAVFVDGRYEIQAQGQVDTDAFDIVPIRETKLEDWLGKTVQPGMKLGFDAWLHTPGDAEKLATTALTVGALRAPQSTNPIDAAWAERPAAPKTPIMPHPLERAGKSAADKRAELVSGLRRDALDVAVLTLPDSIAWLFNIRGDDVPKAPLALAFALIESDGDPRGGATIYTDLEKFGPSAVAHLDTDVKLARWEAFDPALRRLKVKRVSLDKGSAPYAVAEVLRESGAETVFRRDPCALPKARKNAAEIAGARAAHLRDGAAMATALCEIDRDASAGAALSEWAISRRLSEIRAQTAQRLGAEYRGESFDAIVGFGPNAALPHYRVSEASSLTIEGDGLLLLDSGAQYPDGTTDITRTIAIGTPTDDQREAFTRVLKGMIAISQLRFPPKTAGRELDAVARLALWEAGLDFDHGTGHGIGSYLSVHEGPQRLSKVSGVPFEAGMIVSNEPGYYRPGGFGIRIENLVLVTEAELPPQAGALAPERPMHGFETLNFTPIDQRLIALDLLDPDERAWIDAYHAETLAKIGPLVADDVRTWLRSTCAPLI